MSMSTKPALSTPTSLKGDNQSQSGAGSQFVFMALNMSWKLAVVVMVPVVGGALLDRKASGSSHVYLFIGLAIAVIGSIAVMWQAMQAANKLPVPKLSEAEKRKIQQQYEEDDADA